VQRVAVLVLCYDRVNSGYFVELECIPQGKRIVHQRLSTSQRVSASGRVLLKLDLLENFNERTPIR